LGYVYVYTMVVFFAQDCLGLESGEGV